MLPMKIGLLMLPKRIEFLMLPIKIGFLINNLPWVLIMGLNLIDKIVLP